MSDYENEINKQLSKLNDFFNNMERHILTLPLKNPNIPYSNINTALAEIEVAHKQLINILIDLYKNS